MSYGLPHSTLRPHQDDSIQFCLAQTQDDTAIIEAVTGSGKSSFAAATASRKTVVALVRTKNLQRQYQDLYGFDILFGKGNYNCVHPGAIPGTRADGCVMAAKMHKCPVKHKCQYLVQKRKCQASKKVALNYAYYLSANWCRERPPKALFLDEGHDLHYIVTGWSGCTITEKDQADWGLLRFPVVEHHAANILLRLPPPTDLALPWLQDSRDRMAEHYSTLKIKAQRDRRWQKKLRQCENLGRKLRATLDALRDCAEDWYVKSGPCAQWYRGEPRAAFVCRPLTAKHHFSSYFLNDHATIAMSATIGNMAAFTDELGIENYQSLVVPSRFPPESQPVHALDCPAMGSKADGAAFSKQADEIAKAILDQPSEWCGLILVTRKSEAKLLADRLARRGLQDRVWVTPGADGVYAPTDHQLAAWEQRKRKVSNSLCLTWSFGTGFDGLQEKICIAAKAPYPVWGSSDSYEAAWRAYSRKRYTWFAACVLAQWLGRTRRGRSMDYDLNGKKAGYVAIADSSWSRLKSYLPESVLDSITK